MKEDKEDEEQPLAAFVNHPDIEPIHPSRRPVRGRGHGARGVRPLERLETSALGLVALQVVGLEPVVSERVRHVGVLGEGRHLAVREVEAGSAFPLVGHERIEGHCVCRYPAQRTERSEDRPEAKDCKGSEDEGGGRGGDKGGHWAVGLQTRTMLFDSLSATLP